MARPQPNIIRSTRDHLSNQWDILEGDSLYVIVYNNKPISIRQHINSLYNNGFKYRKLSYTHLASATNQVKKLNKLFQTDLFSVKHIA
jgi:hypothetical protein